MSPIRAWVLSAIVTMAVQVSAQSFFFNGTDFTNQVANISTGCATAMQASLDCDPYLTYVMTSNYWGSMGNNTLQDEFCRATCGTDLDKYVQTVQTACKNDPDPLPGYPAGYWGESASAAWSQMCLKDSSTGEYCTVLFENMFAESANDSSDDSTWATNVSGDELCSNCIIALFRHQQATPYSNYDDTMASDWADIQKQCGLSYPTDVPAMKTNITQPGGFAAPDSAKTGCLSENTYAVVSGDNCQAICESKNCATGTLIAINDLYRDCSNLYAGASLCLPPSCTTYIVQSGDTCDKIANASSVTFQQLTAWNPFLDSYCTSLIAGQNICISPPGGPPSLSTIAGATVTQTGIYATATTTRPSPVGVGTTKDCGQYYKVQYGDTCQLIALNQTISIGLFYGINPAIDTSCSNLEVGVYYCVQPTADWNTTATSTIVSPPTTTPSGTTSNCYEFYVVRSGDYCGKVEDMYAISMAQLQYWNPQLLSDCSNLALGEAYCVNGADEPSTGNAFKRGGYGRDNHVYTHLHPRAIRTVQAEVTSAPQVGGVPQGWPGLGAARMNSGAGYGHGEL